MSFQIGDRVTVITTRYDTSTSIWFGLEGVVERTDPVYVDCVGPIPPTGVYGSWSMYADELELVGSGTILTSGRRR